MATRRGTSTDNNRGVGSSQSAGSVSWNNAEDTSQWEEMFKDTPYWPLYLSIIAQYSEDVPDTIAGSLTGANDLNEYDRRQARNQALTQLASQMQKDNYNSPLNQVSLERQAGLNPDLTGISGVGKTDGSDFTPPNATAPNTSSDFTSALGIFNSFSNVLDFATSALERISSLPGIMEDNVLKKLNNYERFTQLASPHIVDTFARYFSGDANDENRNIVDIMNVSGANMGLNKRENKRYQGAFINYLQSNKYKTAKSAYDQLNGNDKAMYDYVNEYAKISSDYSIFDIKNQKDKANAEKKLRDWRNDFNKRMYDDFTKHGSLLAGLILLGHNASVAGMIGQATYGVNKQIYSGTKYFVDYAKKFANFASGFKF